jgi:methylmalonyl-CoA mutase
MVLLGTNQYPNTGEFMGEQVSDPEQKEKEEEGSSYKKLKPFRIASAFEKLRLATEAFVSKGNKRPSVFLFTYGNLSMLRARAAFTTNFFGCGGYSVMDNPGFSDIEEGVRQALESKSEIIVLCSSDDEYPLFAGAVCSQIRASAPGTQVIVAGYPKDHLEALKSDGVDDFIHIRSNLLETLEKYHQKIGIR